MKQKIVLGVQMNCQKCRRKALEVVAETDGVCFLGLEGENKEKVVVIGDGVDAAKLACRLRKKVGYTDIISVSPADN
ncbi:heavy metal-associated isoprenylated plant protein 47-like [Populus alba]|uniref:heavy metal-associated isoprenylated plant protein 47-like n=1 Tax=Populus alba TaxID=43335 RepID=UPI001588CFB6|nr:heavy metal-associated isoprenylated plant protein 47-like [Populus alba]